MQPLEGTRVVDLTVYLAGPTAGMVLGDWGADVIKLEDLTGDPMRPALELGLFDPAPYNYWWEWGNRNKRSVSVDLRRPEGKEVAHRLVEKADIFVSNLRAKGLAKMGLDYETLRRINPQLIYCHSTAYGPRGPEASKTGFDDLGWVRSGLMAVHSFPGYPPVIERAPVGDTPTGFAMASGAVLALMNRQRTGEGVQVNGSLLATMMWLNMWAIQQYIAAGTNLKQLDRERASNPLYNTYPTKDGWLELLLIRDGEWEDLCRALGREDLTLDPRFNTLAKRCQNNIPLIKILEEEFRTRTSEEWRKHLGEYDLTWEVMQQPGEVVVDPQVVANDYLIEVKTPKLGTIRQVANPVQFNKTSFPARLPAPGLGQHTEEVLQELGYTQQQVEELEKGGIIRCWQRVGQKK